MWKWIGLFAGYLLTGSFLCGLLGFSIGWFVDSINTGRDKSSSSGFSNDDYQQPRGTYGYSGQSAYNGYNAFGSGRSPRSSFIYSFIVLGSYVINADGKIMHSEMELMRKFLRDSFGSDVEREGNDLLLSLFQRQKQQGRAAFREEIRRACMEMNLHLDASTRLQMLNFLVLIARADGVLSTEEINTIREIGSFLNLSQADVESILNLESGSSEDGSLEDAYKVLGVSPDATDKEVRAAYRQMALKHHPDRVASLGEDVRKAAEKKFQEINAAKEKIWKARGM